ncbi:MAG: 2-hydroxyacyl-CoA dehydratase subunit D [Candidatus Hodarchaeales archaeon]
MSLMQPKPIESANFMKKILEEYFLDVDKASRTPGEYVAWCSSAGPAELLRAFGFKVYFPENHSAMLGATRQANTYIPIANSSGYSPEICSYLTSDIGAYLKEYTPLTAAYGIESVPKPDVLVYNTNQCRDVQDWFSFYSNKLDVPIAGVHSPAFVPEITSNDVNNVAEQLKQMVPVLEKVTDQRFELNRFKESLTFSWNASMLWKEVLNSAQNIPSPLSFFDSCIHMAPIVVLRGDPIAVTYYEQLKNEMDQRIEEEQFAVPDESIRLYWDGMPIWGKLRSLSNLFIGEEACVVASTYCNSWAFKSSDIQNPFYSMAKGYTEIFINRAENYKEDYLIRLMKDFNVDGIIYHDCKTCPNNSNSRYQLPQRTHEKTGTPYLIIDGDVNDLRCYSEEQSITSIEAFIEQIKSYK